MVRKKGSTCFSYKGECAFFVIRESNSMNTLNWILIVYFSCGILFNLFIFFTGKIRSLDAISPIWKRYLTSVFGFLYYIMIGSMIWLPVIIIELMKKQVKGEN